MPRSKPYPSTKRTALFHSNAASTSCPLAVAWPVYECGKPSLHDPSFARNLSKCGSLRCSGTSEYLNHLTPANSCASNSMLCLLSTLTTYQSDTSTCPAARPTVVVHV